MAEDPRLLLWRRRPDTASVDLNGRVLVLPLDVSPMGSPYALRESVAATWRALDDEPQDFSGLADRLARLHATDPGAIADRSHSMPTLRGHSSISLARIDKTNNIRYTPNSIRKRAEFMARIGLTAERLVEAAAVLADESGFDAVTPTALARVFDVKVASLYSHVANADEIRVRLALYALDRLADQVAEAVAGLAGKDALVALADAHRDFSRRHPGLFAAARHPLDAAAAVRSGGARIAQSTRAVLRGYGLGDTAEVHATRLLGSVFLGFSTLESAGSFSHSQPSSDSSWQVALGALDGTLRRFAQAGGGDD